ncbi:thermonuclease family protein [Mycobacterium sp. URHB0021]
MTASRGPSVGHQMWRSRLVLGAALALSMLASSCSADWTATLAHADTETTATVLRVVDGDTIDVIDDRRGRLRIRVLGIDAPEATKKVGCWGPQATEFAKSALLGARVAIITDPTQDQHDRYGRTLSYLDLEKANGWDYSIEAARNGAAHAYVYGNSPVSRAAEIAAAEQEAKAAGRGLWGPPCFGHTYAAPRR